MLKSIDANNLSMLLVSRDEDFLKMLQNSSLFSEMRMDVADSADRGIWRAVHSFYDVIIFDVSSSENENEIDFSQVLRQVFSIDTPLIFIGGRASNRVEARITFGCDCYIDNKNDLELMRAYSIALVRKSRSCSREIVKCDGVSIDIKKSEMLYNGEAIKIPFVGMFFLYNLISGYPKILYSNSIIHRIYGNKENGDKSFRTQLCKTKSVLKNLGWDHVETVPHVGYRLKCGTENTIHDDTEFSVLCISNSREDNEMMRRCLERLPCSHTVADFSADLLRIISERRYDMVIIDLIVDFAGATMLIKNIRERSASDMFIAVTLSDTAIGCRMLYNGADEFILKPLDEDTLGLEIGFLINRCREWAPYDAAEWKGLKISRDLYSLSYNGIAIDLQPVQFLIVLLMVRRAPGVLRFGEIRSYVFGDDGISQGLVLAHISKIRKEFMKAGYHYMKTIPKTGIRLLDEPLPS